MKSNFLVLILLISGSIYAQYPTQLIVLKDVPQAKYYDAGYFPHYSGHIGFPLLSNISVTASSSGFAMKDFFENKNTVDLSGFVNGLSNKNYLNVGTGIDLFTLGFKIKKNYFSINITPKVDLNLGYNKNLFKFLVEGNGGFVGQTISFEGTGFDASAYNEFGFGFSREINEKLSVGGRLKVLLGIANISGDFDGVGLHTDNDNFEITATSTFSVNQYGAHLTNDSLADAWGASEVNPSNLGYGVDFGGSYDLSDKLNVFASVVDLGYLSWKDYGQRSYNDGASFSFGGVPYSSDTSGSEESNYFDELSDSIQNVFSLKEERTSYKTALKTKIFIGANYKLNKFFDADAVAYGRFFGSKFYPSLMLGVGANLGSWFRVKLSYAATNGSYDNIGAGLVLNLGAFQIYGAMDNLYGLTQLDYAKNLTGSFGINFLIGKNKDDEEKEVDKRKKTSIPVSEITTSKKDTVSKLRDIVPVITTPLVIDKVKEEKLIGDSISHPKDTTTASEEQNVNQPNVLNRDDLSDSISIEKEEINKSPVEKVKADSKTEENNINSEVKKEKSKLKSQEVLQIDAPVLKDSVSLEMNIEAIDSLLVPVKEVNDSTVINLLDSGKTNTFIKE